MITLLYVSFGSVKTGALFCVFECSTVYLPMFRKKYIDIMSTQERFSFMMELAFFALLFYFSRTGNVLFTAVFEVFCTFLFIHLFYFCFVFLLEEIRMI
jgi:hypothetical protein